MNNTINVNMEGVKLGSGLMRYSQVIKVNEKDLELYLDGLSDTPEDRENVLHLRQYQRNVNFVDNHLL